MSAPWTWPHHFYSISWYGWRLTAEIFLFSKPCWLYVRNVPKKASFCKDNESGRDFLQIFLQLFMISHDKNVTYIVSCNTNLDPKIMSGKILAICLAIYNTTFSLKKWLQTQLLCTLFLAKVIGCLTINSTLDHSLPFLWITWIVVKSVLFNWLGPTSHDILVHPLLITIQVIHYRSLSK